jgi:CheY-like chemotaxis protein
MDPLVSRPEDVRVLHVDDELAFAELTATFLEREQETFDVTVETDPTEALARFREERFDCVVSDYDMPSLNGLELLARLREVDPDIPFVLFTGRGSESIAADAIDGGVDYYLRKQTDSSQYQLLADQIASLVDAYRTEKEAAKVRETYELVARVATDAFWIRDMESGVTTYSEGLQRFGYEPGVREDGFEWWAQRVHPDEREAAKELNAAQRAGEHEGFGDVDETYGWFTYEYRWRCADDTYVECRSRGVVRFDDDGEPTEMVGAMTALEPPPCDDTASV